MKENHTMSNTQQALDNLERINGELDPRVSYILKILITAGLPCREYADPSYLEKLADSVHTLWNHLCQLDTGNLEAWDMPVLELASILGRGMGARTFHDSRWPTTRSEESFCKLSSDEMLEAGFTLDSCTHSEFEAFRSKCDEEEEEGYTRTNNIMDQLSEDLNPVDVETELSNVIDMKPEGGDK